VRTRIVFSFLYGFSLLVPRATFSPSFSTGSRHSSHSWEGMKVRSDFVH
jgi:hypothetical protein